MNPNKAARDSKRILKDLDLKLKHESNVCKKGCSYCCHQNIVVHYSEGIAIEKYIDEKMPSTTKGRVKNNMISWFEFFNQATPNRNLLEEDVRQVEMAIVENKVPCPFLVDNECSIYEVRPLTCRAHFVVDSVEDCEVDRLRNSAPLGQQLRGEFLLKLNNIEGLQELRFLPYATRETLGIQGELKGVLTQIRFRKNHSA